MLAILESLILPSNFALLLLWSGLALLLMGRLKPLAIALLLTSALVTSFFSSGIVASYILAPLEYHYPINTTSSHSCKIQQIVVLTGYATDDKDMPLSSRISSSAAYRVLEASHLLNQCPNRNIVISGNRGALILREILLGTGIDEKRIVIDTDSPHTDSSATNLQPLLGKEPFYLITSAGHMPRSMGVFLKLGMYPIASPTDFSLSKDPLNSSASPSPMHLQFSDQAINEYAGLLWYYLTGKI